MVTIDYSYEYIILKFDAKPEQKIIDTLKACGWWYSVKQNCWRNIKNDENIQWAKELCKAVNPSASVKFATSTNSSDKKITPITLTAKTEKPPTISLKKKPQIKKWLCGRCLNYFDSIKQFCPDCETDFCVESNAPASDRAGVFPDDLIKLISYGATTNVSVGRIKKLINLAKDMEITIPSKIYPALKGITGINDLVETNETKTLGYRDFLIRCTNFTCMSKGHHMETIDAEINILPKNLNSDVYSKIVPAAYCEDCDEYFILEDVYSDIRKFGMPLCPVCDEKVARSNHNNPGGIRFAEESILKQFGYSVSQETGLSEETRQSLLAVLLDKGVVSKNEILSYLESFINFRKDQSKYDKAIAKWKEDADFVKQYRIGNYSLYKVSGLRR